MATTLTYGATTLPLPADLLWADEYSWKKVVQRTRQSVTGALLVEAAALQAGRPITLSGEDNRAWVTRTVLDTLRAWADLPGQTFHLVVRDGAPLNVVFGHEAGAIEAQPVGVWDDVQPGDYYRVTLRFIEV